MSSPPPHSARQSRWIELARWATVVAACSVMISPPLANAAMALMLVGLLASGQAWPRLRQACAQPLGIVTLVLIGVVAVAMLWADVPWRERWSAFWTWRKLWMIPVALALFGPAPWKRRLVVAYVAICGAAVGVSFVLVLLEGRLPTMYELELSGSLLRNHSAQSMAFATAALLALWLAADATLERGWRWAAAALAALFVLNMAFVTPGRSGFLALAVMLAALAAFNLRSGRSVIAAAVLATLLAGTMALSPLARDRFSLALDEWRNASTQTYKTSLGMRAVIYENTLEVVRERPWFGTGTGGFGAAYAERVRGRYSDWRAVPTVDPHNQYLFFLAEQGIFGLFAFLAFIVAGLVDRGDGTRARAVAVAMLLGWCATSLLSSHFKTFSEGHLVTLFLGAMLARPLPGLDGAAAGARIT
ncbi:MAG TPA: O-antigen ligase family protein [Burkholderiaceae bacterium]|nr:O-antigen ligase family protein [Burkholderiaceae bacterium]HQR69742.1 O-antigen ligase family protein [Burkholderiaceae bacterium]